MKYNYFQQFIIVLWLILHTSASAVIITIPTPAGPIDVDITHAGPTGQLVEPDPPTDAGFRPPTIFSAPLPVGSGARALGQAGAFTAVADDATAASWNPAGLVQLEQPEISAVYRYSAKEDTHASGNRDLDVGRDRYDSSELNYLSAAYPFLLNDRNTVISLNIQEAYDFTHKYIARFSGNTQHYILTVTNQVFLGTITDVHSNALRNITSVADITTDAESRIDQVLNSSLLSDISFRQSGTIDAFSPAFAFSITPKLSLGVAINIYTDGAYRGKPVESSMVADYEGTSDSVASIIDTRNSTAVINYSGEEYIVGPSGVETNPITPGVHPAMFDDSETNNQNYAYAVEGAYREDNNTEDFYGINATIGMLWAHNENLTLGASVDLPWVGRGHQIKRINHQVSTFDSNRVQVATSSLYEMQKRDVEFTFPLYWSIGALWRWSDRFYTSMDVSRTHWSDFSYKAEGEERINPITGEPHASSALDDCWSARLGGEYLCMLSRTEIPLRGGLFWEQRPAARSPDEYWGFSLGSGLSLGRDPARIILDVAYVFEQGRNVMGALLPGQAVHSDTIKHQLFCSAIWHF